MISFASLVLLAQVATPPEAVLPPPALVARVQEAIAVQWAVDPSSVELEWGRLPTLAAADLVAPLRVGPISREGWLAITLDAATRAPRAVRLRAGLMASQPVATRGMATGTALSGDDITWTDAVRWGPPDTTQAPVAEGWEIRRAVRAGDPLVGTAVAPPRAVATGGALRVFWQQNGVEIELEGIALTAARVGERAQVRTSTGRVTVRMTGPGVARIEGGVP